MRPEPALFRRNDATETTQRRLAGMNPDPIAIARRLLNRAEKELVERIIAAGEIRGYFLSALQEFMTTLGKLPHATANWILDLDRGWHARRLTHVETQLVQEAWGSRINPADVRIVKGAGLSAWAAIAFRKGNPAITLGNTIYIKSDLKYLTHSDLSNSLRGIEMLLHEYTHVVQYATLGFAGSARAMHPSSRRTTMIPTSSTTMARATMTGSTRRWKDRRRSSANSARRSAR